MLSKIVHDRSSSRLFEPLLIANGRIELKHRVIYAPMTRLRGVPTEPSRTDDQRTTSWYPEDLAAEYYGQRATEGGLLISEATPVTVQVRPTRHLKLYLMLPSNDLVGHGPPRCTRHLPRKAAGRLEESDSGCS